jgi:hypothetical protein
VDDTETSLLQFSETDMTMLTNEQFNRALEIYQEFGPRRRIPIHQRWQEAFPQAAPDEMKDWERAFRDIEKFAHSVAEQVRDHGLDERAAAEQISEQFPRLTPDRVATTYNQARYIAMM